MTLQTARLAELSTPLGADKLILRSMTATEQLSGLFEFDLDVLCDDETLKFDDVLGQTFTVRLSLHQDKERFFNGYVSRFSQAGRLGEYAWYRATLRPWLWFLTRTSDCRIFQDLTIPEIIRKVFADHDIADFKEALSRTYTKWEYCVQYRETDFNFISRLMEQEGIYYFFTHAKGRHTMVLADSYGSHQKVPGYEKVPYFPPTANVVREEDHFSEWFISREIQPGAYALNDFDFEKPRASLAVRSTVARKHPKADLEIYDYPGEYDDTSDGNTYARDRIEELHVRFEQTRGMGSVRGLGAGHLFELTESPRADQNREYLVVSTSCDLRVGDYASGSAAGAASFTSTIEAIDSKQTFRAPRVTPKPMVQGPQTALVVGKSGEEIWTDKYGRVKVQFHWDREGKADENSSCWVRVAQVWAGKNWGGIQIPRIGQEVIVEFLEGDPDWPIITGSVYNADTMPPYGLPDNATQSGMKTRSTKGAGTDNFNELRFEDKKGSEQVYFHAERNMDGMVEVDETHTVGNDRTKDVKHDEKTTIGNDRTENVGKNESITIGENRTESVGKDESITIGNNRTESVGKDESISIGANRAETVGKDETISIAGNRSEDVTKKETVTIGDDRAHSVGKNDQLQVGKKLVIEAGDEVSIVTGQASIVMKKDGKVTIKGKDITIEGSGKINVKASGDITMKGSAIKQN